MTQKLTNGYNIQEHYDGTFDIVHYTGAVIENGSVIAAPCLYTVKTNFKTYAGAEAHIRKLENEGK